MSFHASFIEFHETLGSLVGKLNWLVCQDTNGSTLNFRWLEAKIDSLRLRSRIIFEEYLNGQNDDNLMLSLASALETGRERVEAAIELEYRPKDLFFNKDALIICTNKSIPEDIQIGLSFGYKFLFPYSDNDNNLYKLLAQLEMTIEQALPDLNGLEASVHIQNILKKHSSTRIFNDTISWLKFISKRTASFFKANPDIVAIRTDKGAHTAVMNVSDYNTKLEQHLADNVYVQIDVNPLAFLVSREIDLVDQLMVFPKIKSLSDRLVFQPNILSLSKFYGLPKIHKTNIPLRPITSTVNSPGYFLGKLFYRMLDTIFPRTTHHIKDSYEFVEFINNVQINENDILVSFDVVSMYTSIPFELVFELIMKKSNDFLTRFGINKQLLCNILIFLLEECSVFRALDGIYKQRDGLPMGSCLSPLVARIFMDEVVIFLLNEVPVSFIRVFVDDTIVAMNANRVNDALAVLNNFALNKVRFTLERENNHRSINFLNVTLTREGGAIFTNWYRKSFASGRLLNFYSSHKRATVLATGAHFIKTVLFLSDPRFYHENRDVIIETLHKNSFPEIIIMTLMNEYYTFMRPVNHDKHKNDNDQYVIFPYAIRESKKIRNVIYNFKNSSISLADSVKNTKINHIKSVKTLDPIASSGNVVLDSTCRCGHRCIIGATRFNESAKMARKRLLSRRKQCDMHGHAFRKFNLRKGLYYNNQTQYLLRYVQWMHRHKLDATSCPYHFPLYSFSKLLKCKCCK